MLGAVSGWGEPRAEGRGPAGTRRGNPGAARGGTREAERERLVIDRRILLATRVGVRARIALRRNATSAEMGFFPTPVDMNRLGGTYARRLDRAAAAAPTNARTPSAAAARPARPRAAAAAGPATTNAAPAAGPRSAAGPASWATASGPGATAASRCVTYACGREHEERHYQQHEQPIERIHDQTPSAGNPPLFRSRLRLAVQQAVCPNRTLGVTRSYRAALGPSPVVGKTVDTSNALPDPQGAGE
jgi:hypothetical protein